MKITDTASKFHSLFKGVNVWERSHVLSDGSTGQMFIQSHHDELKLYFRLTDRGEYEGKTTILLQLSDEDLVWLDSALQGAKTAAQELNNRVAEGKRT